MQVVAAIRRISWEEKLAVGPDGPEPRAEIPGLNGLYEERERLLWMYV